MVIEEDLTTIVVLPLYDFGMVIGYVLVKLSSCSMALAAADRSAERPFFIVLDRHVP